MGFYGFDWPCLNAVLSFSCIPTAGFPDASSHTCRNRIRTKNIKTQDLSYKICLALQDLAVLLNENPLSSPGKLSLPCLSHPWFACFHFFARRKYELTTKSKRFSMIFIFIALSRPVSDKFAVHLARNPRKSVAGVLLCLPPGTEFPRKCSRCPFLPPTWHGIPAKAFQVSLSASHLARNSCKSVPGVTFCLPPGTEFLQKCSRCLFSAVHLARYSSESVPGASSPPSTWHGISAKACQVSFPAVHLPRYSCKSVPGDIFLSPTWHGIPAKAWQVAPLIAHLPRQFLSSWDVGAFQQDKLVVCSMERVAVCTPAVGECVHLSEYHDVLRMA